MGNFVYVPIIALLCINAFLCIADSFDAMISVRPYKEPYSKSVALKILEDQAGLQFDPKLVRIFIEIVRNGIIKVCEEDPESCEVRGLVV